MLFEGGLVREELIQGAVAAVVVDEGRGHAEQILQGGLAIPRLGEVEFAGRLTEAGQHQDRHHGWPGDRLPARGQQPLQQGLQLQRAPEQPAEPHIAEGAPPLQAHAVQPDGHGRGRGIRRLEEVALRLTTGESRGQRPGAGPPLGIELPKLGDGLLDDLLAHPDRADQAPVRVSLAILAARRMAEIHDAFTYTRRGADPSRG